MNDFERALAFVLKWEGGDKVTEDSVDPGGLTKYGISKHSHPDVDIRNLTYPQARDIYLSEYWNAGKCDLLPKPLNIAHFDACVNCGKIRATKFLQKVLHLRVDGVIGSQTISAVLRTDPGALAIECILERDNYYKTLVENQPALHKYLNGWMNRTSDLMKEIAR